MSEKKDRTSESPHPGAAGVVVRGCPSCGAENPADNVFCERCGAPLERENERSRTADRGPKCPYCDARVGAEDIFCGECGKQLPRVPEEEIRMRITRPLIVGIVAVVVVGCIIVALVTVVLGGGVLHLSPQASPTSTPRAVPGSPTATPTPSMPMSSVTWLTYESGRLGFSIRYPQGWLVRDIPGLPIVVFEAEEAAGLRGTSLGVQSVPAGQLGAGNAQGVAESMQEFWQENFECADMEAGEPESVLLWRARGRADRSGGRT